MALGLEVGYHRGGKWKRLVQTLLDVRRFAVSLLEGDAGAEVQIELDVHTPPERRCRTE